jgi:hypothetical protein
MKNYIIVFALFIGVQTMQAQNSVPAGNAQNQSATISDDELKKYAITRDSIDDMKETLMKELTAMVQNNSKVKVARYNELSKIIGNEAELTKANATPEEIAFVKEVAAKREQGTAKIQEMLQTMAKDYVGTTSYNRIKKALATDPEVQKRYQAHLEKIDESGVN